MQRTTCPSRRRIHPPSALAEVPYSSLPASTPTSPPLARPRPSTSRRRTSLYPGAAPASPRRLTPHRLLERRTVRWAPVRVSLAPRCSGRFWRRFFWLDWTAYHARTALICCSLFQDSVHLMFHCCMWDLVFLLYRDVHELLYVPRCQNMKSHVYITR